VSGVVSSTPSLGEMYLRIHFTHQIQESHRPLNVLFPDNKGGDSPFEGICLECPVRLWNQAKIQEFISHRLSQTGVTFTEEEINYLVRQSQGKPRELMQSCFKLYQSKVNNSASQT
jgi:hypothetical protein